MILFDVLIIIQDIYGPKDIVLLIRLYGLRVDFAKAFWQNGNFFRVEGTNE